VGLRPLCDEWALCRYGPIGGYGPPELTSHAVGIWPSGSGPVVYAHAGCTCGGAGGMLDLMPSRDAVTVEEFSDIVVELSKDYDDLLPRR
jgi:hypothetical protein